MGLIDRWKDHNAEKRRKKEENEKKRIQESRGQLPHILPGMEEAEVISLLGQPAEKKRLSDAIGQSGAHFVGGGAQSLLRSLLDSDESRWEFKGPQWRYLVYFEGGVVKKADLIVEL